MHGTGLRQVVQGDAITWIKNQEELPCVITSLPDITELAYMAPKSGMKTEMYQEWLVGVAYDIVSRLAGGCVCIFYQTDVKGTEGNENGEYIDKAFWITCGALKAKGSKQLWHKIALRNELDTVRIGGLGYTHLIAFSGPKGGVKNRQEEVRIPDCFHRGVVEWPRGMGNRYDKEEEDKVKRGGGKTHIHIRACKFLVEYLRDAIHAKRVCIPFCGSGAVLCYANALGLDAVGVEKTPKRAKKARRAFLDAEGLVKIGRVDYTGIVQGVD